jgi:alpha-tubulin suppressor-like RCC1 family protein
MTTIPSDKTPFSMSCGYSHTIVLMTDGTIYGCGDNTYGQLGNGTNTPSNKLTPMTIPSDKTPCSIYCGNSGNHTIVLMTDGTIYGCGLNTSRQLGNGTYNNSSTLTACLISSGNPITNVKSLANNSPIITTTTTETINNDNTNFCKGCQICTDNSTTDHIVEYKPLKTMRHTDNISQKMKQAAFIRRTQNTSITQTDAINFRFKNL